MLVLLLLACLGSVSARMRIVNGQPTDTTQHPHQVALRYNGGFTCGGSIIASRWALTAAHCVDNRPDEFTIELNNGRIGEDATTIKVLDIVMHPDYQIGAGAYPNDIALLYMESTLLVNHHKAIQLASGTSDFVGENCIISGWGRLSGGGVLPEDLQQTTGNILGDGFINGCGSILNWGSSYNHDVHICIHNSNTGSCSGDSGGPMVCSGVLAGVTSWGASQCLTSSPSVYARVTKYRSWIREVANV